MPDAQSTALTLRGDLAWTRLRPVCRRIWRRSRHVSARLREWSRSSSRRRCALKRASAERARRLQPAQEPRPARPDARYPRHRKRGGAGESLAPPLKTLQAKSRENAAVLRCTSRRCRRSPPSWRAPSATAIPTARIPPPSDFPAASDDQGHPERRLDLHHHAGVELHGGVVEGARHDCLRQVRRR